MAPLKNTKRENGNDLEGDSSGSEVVDLLLDLLRVDPVLLDDGLVLLHLPVLRLQHVEQEIANQAERGVGRSRQSPDDLKSILLH